MPQQKRVILLITIVILVLASLPGLKIIADALMKETAYQLVVNGKTWFAVSRKEALDKLLDQYQRHYLKNIDKHAKVKTINFSQNVEILEVRVKPEEIDTLKAAKRKTYAIEEEAVEVEIRKGDNFWNLSRANNLTVNELESLNPDLDPDKLLPGDKVIVKPLNPKLDVVVELENTIVESVPFKIEYQYDRNLYRSQKKIIREGTEGQKEVVYNITLLNGYQSSLQVKSERALKKPINAIVRVGTKTTVSRGGRINYGVVNGKRVSSLFGSRIHPITGRRRFHDGLDIAASYGNGVYVYTDGRVVQSGWNGGYGLSILVDHGNGLKTRYGHLSKIYVRVGQRVQTGAKIGAVGSTGNSTGPHLHFEVIKYGRTKNPLNYI